ncbi:MAG: lamin tail domain-containing protein, partial [Candidatus Marinimicrobia bacterium]|nr:lamin tail domain-containing protein [Candidatus Neomarinimicrobiota bacterium]
MKKVIGILFLLVLMVTFTLGQSVSEVWIIPADDTNAAAWQAAGNARGIDINTASTTTGNTVLYADNVKKTVHVHNAADGSYIHSLDTTGIVGSGIFGWLDPYRVAVTQDGQVFACAYDGRVVRWADDAVTTPGALAIDPVADGHTGSSRAFEVVGSGNSVRVFVGKGTDILVYDDDGTGTFAENTTLTIATGWSTECEAIASSDSNLVYASEVGSGSDQKPFRRIYELTAAGYVNNETLVAALPYTTWFQPNGLDVGAGYYILAEAAGDYDGFAIGTIAGANYNPESGDTAPIDNVYDAGMNGASTVADIAFDPATLRAYWTTAGTGATAGIGCIQFNPQTAPAVFFSEYIEGSSNNKALEIYNGTDAAINLPDFRVAQSSNGGGWKYYHTFPEAATLAVGDVWVMLNSDTSPDYYAAADADEVLSYPSAVHHNGDDARGLEWTPDGGTTWHFADIIGDPNNDPGSGWDVAGVTLGTYNHTMVRKATVTSGNTDWAASAGTNATDSEWEVYDQNTFDYLGVHPGTPPPTISSVSATSDTTVEILFSKAIDVTTGETVTNYSIDNGIGNPVLATVSTDTVLLKVATLSGNITYTLTVNNIKDLDANTIEANSTATFVLDTEPAQTGVVVINEVGEPYTMTNTWEDSYIELYNTTDAAIDVSGWVVWSVAVTKGTSSFEFPSGTEIATDGYLIATRDRTKFLVDYGAYVAEAIVPAAAAVTGSGVYIKYDYYFALINQNGDTIDVTGSTIDWNSKTWEKESPELDGSVDDNWHLTYQTAPVEGTPGQPNSTPPPPSPYTIAEIQDTTGSGSDASALVGEGALTKGIVTAVGSGKFVIQDGDSAWSAIWVNNSTTVTLGDSVEV